jgi:hypothetical protein
MLPLEPLQAAFGSALRTHARTTVLLPLLEGDAALNMRRIGLYRGNVLANAQRALAASYPVIEQIVGNDFFAATASRFWQAHPPQAGDWHMWGGAFADFLAHFEHAQTLPYLPALARLEWAVHLAQFAADSDADSEVLARPGTRVLAQRAPIASLWLAHQLESTISLEDIGFEPQGALVFREGFHVQVSALPFDQACILTEHLESASHESPV